MQVHLLLTATSQTAGRFRLRLAVKLNANALQVLLHQCWANVGHTFIAAGKWRQHSISQCKEQAPSGI
jgi:hypothetical protein